MLFPRVIRLDASDDQVFPRAAAEDEWAVPGTFAFADTDPDTLSGKARQAFFGGWLGTESFGRATVARVATMSDDEFEVATVRLARHLTEAHGAPDMMAALAAARDEASYAVSLCDHPTGTLLAVERSLTDAGVAERVRPLFPPDPGGRRIWEILADDG